MPIQTSAVTTIFLSLLFTSLLCTCDRAPQQKGATEVIGTLRYQEDQTLLEATARLDNVNGTAAAPKLLGSVMEPLVSAGPGNFRARRSSAFPVNLKLAVPCPAGDDCPINWTFQAPYADSIPATLSKSVTSRIPVMAEGLKQDESLVLFFEPRIRKTPRRLQLIGPSSTGFLTLRKEALADIPTGDYRVYLVKQQLHKDSTASVVSSIQTEFFTKSREITVVE